MAATCGAILLIVAVQAYRNLFPRMMLSTCRFQPTCSQYALETLHREGAWKGARLVIRRLLRCLPWRSSGYDPAP